ncbi:hypothetical protein K431DRAFT_112310 [Polychaeton citri CBS 116435]|uniref:Uncharacterized protein n=1 Tax=Polychaeton citri CBS 116435 TaxID=1314669 RepID=A0A9P4UMD5_9PEZI|nr:hypothetical protein K431DRAFT_112310 [Polychaeton citri CBS 116435]
MCFVCFRSFLHPKKKPHRLARVLLLGSRPRRFRRWRDKFPCFSIAGLSCCFLCIARTEAVIAVSSRRGTIKSHWWGKREGCQREGRERWRCRHEGCGFVCFVWNEWNWLFRPITPPSVIPSSHFGTSHADHHVWRNSCWRGEDREAGLGGMMALAALRWGCWPRTAVSTLDEGERVTLGMSGHRILAEHQASFPLPTPRQ